MQDTSTTETIQVERTNEVATTQSRNVQPSDQGQRESLRTPGSNLSLNVALILDRRDIEAAVLKLAYGDDIQSFSRGSDFQEIAWETPLNPRLQQYTYEVIWHPRHGSPITMGPQTQSVDNTHLVLQSPRLEEFQLVTDVRGFAVDYAVTPFVDVALEWGRGEYERHRTFTLHHDCRRKEDLLATGGSALYPYHYDIVYNLADGSRIPGASGETTDPIISIMPYQVAG
ncbi:hypothetical protein C7271_04745 [filamentous cyanobacterium CCP5]|nr:hypothetical protein C7271_04745 [filamentous cyanobacterium CCP5]